MVAVVAVVVLLTVMGTPARVAQGFLLIAF
jgi:hypothetical protein